MFIRVCEELVKKNHILYRFILSKTEKKNMGVHYSDKHHGGKLKSYVLL